MKKIKEIIHKNTLVYLKGGPSFKIILDAIHDLQEKVELLMSDLTDVADDVEVNTTYISTGKYVTPAGRFKTYAAAAAGNDISTYMVKKHIKDESNTEYYIDLDTPIAITIPL